MRCTGNLHLAYPNDRQLSDPFYQALRIGLLRMDLAPEQAAHLGILLRGLADTEDSDLAI
jgi:hypothetical protein